MKGWSLAMTASAALYAQGAETVCHPWNCVAASIVQDWVKVSSELAQGRRAWSASVRDVVNSIGDAGSTRPG